MLTLVYKSVLLELPAILHIIRLLSVVSTNQLMSVFVLSRLDSCNCLLFPLNTCKVFWARICVCVCGEMYYINLIIIIIHTHTHTHTQSGRNPRTSKKARGLREDGRPVEVWRAANWRAVWEVNPASPGNSSGGPRLPVTEGMGNGASETCGATQDDRVCRSTWIPHKQRLGGGGTRHNKYKLFLTTLKDLMHKWWLWKFRNWFLCTMFTFLLYKVYSTDAGS